ncbi:hypothetical protein Cs308_0330 [Candidatus Chlamydia sanziniae]|uniref:Uncharacterized protein n=1 Tax=Candidatus Chlamydia sanziniae TaxID=1806891 RepID=A0A1A9HVQ7_9CHLA|nr:hypothetical protein Cs308_0330 [Candidatus Chlamydia sanziniae]
MSSCAHKIFDGKITGLKFQALYLYFKLEYANNGILMQDQDFSLG